MSIDTENYRDNAASDAADTVSNFEDEILEQLIDSGEASDDLLNDYPGGDAWHHESHVDKWYDLQEAAAVLDQLSEHEETDSGLWEGLEPRRAIGAQAAYTYGNAVYSEWRDLIERINDEASDIVTEYDDEAVELESEIEELNDQANDAESEVEADQYLREAEQKQDSLNDITERKTDALRKMIEEVASR